jgi:hypothetical protein
MADFLRDELLASLYQHGGDTVGFFPNGSNLKEFAGAIDGGISFGSPEA